MLQGARLGYRPDSGKYVWVWAGEWCGESLSFQLSLAGENIDQERRGSMTKWDLKFVA